MWPFCRDIATAVERETGWSWPLCAEISGAFDRRNLLPDALLGAAFVAGAIAWYPAAGWIFRLVKGGAMLPDWAVFLLIVGFIVPGPLLAAAGLVVMCGVRRQRFVRRYLSAPWCLRCEYPVDAPPEATEPAVCPECGEPIAPEVLRRVRTTR